MLSARDMSLTFYLHDTARRNVKQRALKRKTEREPRAMEEPLPHGGLPIRMITFIIYAVKPSYRVLRGGDGVRVAVK